MLDNRILGGPRVQPRNNIQRDANTEEIEHLIQKRTIVTISATNPHQVPVEAREKERIKAPISQNNSPIIHRLLDSIIAAPGIVAGPQNRELLLEILIDKRNKRYYR